METQAANLERSIGNLVFNVDSLLQDYVFLNEHPELDRKQLQLFKVRMQKNLEARLEGQFGGCLGLIEEKLCLKPNEISLAFLASKYFLHYREDLSSTLKDTEQTFEHCFLLFLEELVQENQKIVSELESIYMLELKLECNHQAIFDQNLGMPDLENSGHNNAMQAFEIVRQSWLFSELTQEEVQKIVSVGKVVSLSPGHVLLEKAKPNDSLYIILDGIFSVRAKTPTEFKKLVELQAGDIFGEMSWLDGHPASSYVVSDTASKVLKIPFEALNEALYQMSGAYIQILKKFAINLSHRLRA